MELPLVIWMIKHNNVCLCVCVFMGLAIVIQSFLNVIVIHYFSFFHFSISLPFAQNGTNIFIKADLCCCCCCSLIIAQTMFVYFNCYLKAFVSSIFRPSMILNTTLTMQYYLQYKVIL